MVSRHAVLTWPCFALVNGLVTSAKTGRIPKLYLKTIFNLNNCQNYITMFHTAFCVVLNVMFIDAAPTRIFFKPAYLRQLLASLNAKRPLGCQIAQQKTRVELKVLVKTRQTWRN